MEFYKDQSSGFECNITIEGASTNQSKARLVLYFDTRTLMFESDLVSGQVSIKIPQLSEIDDTHGRAVLEVIAENTYFEAWRSDFDLVFKKSVSIQEIQVDRTDSAVVTIQDVESFEYRAEDNTDIFAENCSPKNENYSRSILTEINDLDETEKSDLDSILREFKPNEDVLKWGDSVFENPTTRLAQFCMYKIQSTYKEN